MPTKIKSRFGGALTVHGNYVAKNCSAQGVANSRLTPYLAACERNSIYRYRWYPRICD